MNNTALQFDGSQNYVTFGTPITISDASPYTVEAWINPSVLASSYGLILGATAFGDAQLYFDTSVNAVIANTSGVGGGITSAPSSVPAGQWTHIAVTWDGSTTLTLWINGVSAGTSATIGQWNLYGIIYNISDPNKFYGTLDEVRISDIVRYTTTFIPDKVLGSDANTIAYYNFNEGTGLTLTDISGNGHNGTLIGTPTPTWVMGMPNNFALQFDGATQYVNVPANSAFYPTGDFTFEMWLKAPNTQSGYIGFGNTNGSTGYLMAFEPLISGVYFGVNSGAIISSRSIQDNTWHHVALVGYSGTMTCYVDGFAGATTMGYSSVNDLGSAFTIGLQSSSGYYTGAMSEMRISSVARYTADFVPPMVLGTDGNTISYWKFADGTGSIAVDSSGNGNDGTLIGTPLPAWIEGVGKYEALQFDGSQNYVTTTSDAITIPSGGATVEFWFNEPAGTSLGEVTMMEHWGGSGWGTFINNINQIGIQGTGVFMLSGTGTVQDNQWHHIAFVDDGAGTVYLYLDGTQITSTSGTLAMTSALRIGGDTVTSWYTVGKIDEVRISSINRYTGSFTPATSLGTDGNTIAYYKFDEGSGLAIIDSSGNGHIGILQGSPVPNRVVGLTGSLPPAVSTLYFTNHIDTSWDTLANWYIDSGLTTVSAYLPIDGDAVIVVDGATLGTGPSVPVQPIFVKFVDTAGSGTAINNTDISAFTGSIEFNSTSYNNTSGVVLTGSFYDTSYNLGTSTTANVNYPVSLPFGGTFTTAYYFGYSGLDINGNGFWNGSRYYQGNAFTGTWYFYPSIDGNWSTLGNWWTADGQTGGHPLAAIWTDTDTVGDNATLSTSGTAPLIDITVGSGLTITGTCDIAGVATDLMGGWVDAGIFSGDGFTNDGYVGGGTFSGIGFINSNNGTIGSGIFNGSGFANNYTINGGSFSGAGFTNNSTITGGTFTGTGFTNTGTITGAKFGDNAVTTIIVKTQVTLTIDGLTLSAYQTLPQLDIVGAGLG